jgi:hypothetical protein
MAKEWSKDVAKKAAESSEQVKKKIDTTKKLSKEFTQKPVENDVIDNAFYVLFWPNIGLFLFLIFLPVQPEYKIFIFGLYLLGSIAYIFLVIRSSYSKNNYMNSRDFYENILHHPGTIRHKVYKNMGIPFSISLFAFIIFYYFNLSISVIPALEIDLFTLSIFTFLLWILICSSQVLLCRNTSVLFFKDYNFYKANEKLQEYKSDLTIDKKTKLLLDVLKTYNKYIARRTGFEIRDSTKVCSKILSNSNKSVDDLVNDMKSSFDQDNKNYDSNGQLKNDGLSPLRTICAMFNEYDEILKYGHSKEKIKAYLRPLIPMLGPALGFIIPIVARQMGLDLTTTFDSLINPSN